MSLEKDFAFASTNYLISLNSIKKKSGKEFADISAIMEGFYDQMEAIVTNHTKEMNELRIKSLVTSLERDYLAKEVGVLMNETFQKDKELFDYLMKKFMVLPPRKNEPKG